MKKKTLSFQNCLGVFQGGGCRGAAFVGAYKEAKERGVSFSEIVGTSAGAIVAAFISAGATPEKLEEIISRLNFNELISDPLHIEGFKSKNIAKIIYPYSKDIYRVIVTAGMHSSDKLKDWVDKELKLLLNKTTSVKFSDLIIPMTLVVTDLKAKKVKLFGNSYDEDDYVAEAVRMSCNIPIYFQPIEKRFVDGGLLSNLPSFVFKSQQETSYEKVLAFSLSSENVLENNFNDIESYFDVLTNAAIDGSMDMQLALQKNIHIIDIPTGSIKATDFKTITDQDITFLVEMGEKATSDFFEEEVANLKTQYNNIDINYDSFKAYNEIALSSSNHIQEVIFSDYDTEWVYELFPTIVSWVKNKARITVIIKINNDTAIHGPYRKKLLESLGCEVLEQEELPLRGVIINGDDIDTAKALVFNEAIKKDGRYHSKSYYGEADFKVISVLREVCLKYSKSNFIKNNLKLQPINNDELFSKLRGVKQYHTDMVTFKLQEVSIENLTFITRYIRGFKYRQIGELFNLYKINNVETFVPAKLIWADEKTSVITPPIIEAIGSKLFVIEGNTRITYAYKNGITTIKAIVVTGVTEPFPSSGRYKVNEVLISDREVKGETRYKDWNYSLFRKIESAVRNPTESIKLL